MTKRRAMIVVEFEGGSPRAISTLNDIMANIAEGLIDQVHLAGGIHVVSSVGAVCDTIPRHKDRKITVEDLNNVVFRGTGTKQKKGKK